MDMTAGATGTDTGKGSVEVVDEGGLDLQAVASTSTSSAHPATTAGVPAPEGDKPLHEYYSHLLKYRHGKLVKPKKPLFFWARSGEWFITAVVCVGVMSDLLAYAIVVPVLPFRLQALEYDNVAALMSWLLFAYSAGIFISTFPVAFFFHKYPWRRGPLVIAVLVMEGSFLLFMLARPYWAMVISRVIQGACSCVVWTVGFALICENIDPSRLGTHLGFAFSGLSIGSTIAPPIGGALYKHLGWHAPFIFVMIICGVDAIARMFILEKHDVARYHARVAAYEEAVAAGGHMNEEKETETDATPAPPRIESEATVQSHEDKIARFHVPVREAPVELSAWQVLVTLASLPRGMVAFLLVFVFGFIVGAIDSTLAVRAEDVWHKDSDFVGLMYLAAASPAFFGGPISGWLADKYGSEWIILPSVVFCLPWLPLMTLKSSLAGFMVYFAMTMLVVTVLNSVASLEMAIVSKFKPGVSEIHEFAAMNLAFAVSSAIGAIVGGQIYDHVHNGWNVVMWIGFGAFALSIVPPLIWTGKIPLLSRVLRRPPPRSCIPPDEREYWDKKARGEDPEAATVSTATAAVEPKCDAGAAVTV